MARNSLPAPTVTPRAGNASLARSQSTVKRRKLSHPPEPEPDHTPLGPSGRPTRRAAVRVSPVVDPPKPTVPKDGEADAEQELEAWQDFAAEHYEMVEQLPLELHRNFRLLRELDDGCQGQQAKLESLIREYISARLQAAAPKAEEKEVHESTEQASEVRGPEEVADLPPNGGPADQPDVSEEATQPNGHTADTPVDVEPVVYENEHILAAEAEGVPVPDGQGGLVLPPVETNGDVPPAEEHHVPIPFPWAPATPPGGDLTPTLMPADEDSNPTPSVPQPSVAPISRRSAAQQPPSTGPHTVLPHIARLAREILRTGEEKVAVALGAYNSIDRHIRALDSALEAHESAIILGMRADTMPSSAVGALQGGGEAVLEPDEGAIGLEGGPRNRKKKKGKKRQQGEGEAAAMPALPEGLEVDPNEPRYCYCQQVSYGEMIACENEECPLEWFHLACAGFSAPPAGKWWCNVCRPKVGLGKGGGPGVQPRAANQKKSRKSR